jgi:hypothetical protein|tara:strand:+ start:714 stop:947 length:234 start_codon:yes stop_codon:yes gene_type:complete
VKAWRFKWDKRVSSSVINIYFFKENLQKPTLLVKKGEWARQDLNLRPPGYQPGAPTNLSYPPKGEPRHSGIELNGSD